MKVLVISDNHSEKNILTEVYDTVKPDAAIHLGDSEFPYDDPEMEKFLRVKGNTDRDDSYPETGLLEETGMFYTHGHLFGIKSDRNTLAEKALETGAKYALYGHSHVAKIEKVQGVYVINPGSITSSRNEYPESYLVIDTDTKIASYYSRKHKLMDEFNLGN